MKIRTGSILNDLLVFAVMVAAAFVLYLALPSKHDAAPLPKEVWSGEPRG